MKVDEADRSRPFAYADPRSLSEAWYDALYGAKVSTHARAPQDAPRRAETEARPAGTAGEAESETTTAQPRPVRVLATRPHATSEALFVDAEDAPQVAARKRTRAAKVPTEAQSPETERSDIDVDDGNGGVKLLIAQRHGEVDVVAICERTARERTADALARARIALGARGITLNTTLREKTEGEAR